MRVKVCYFASLREYVGQAETSLELDQTEITIRAAWFAANPNLALPPNILTAVNFNYSNLDEAVRDGDEVAFFPPVTGG